MTDLIARIESADGPDREIDCLIAVAVCSHPTARVSWRKGWRWFSKPGAGRMAFAGFGGKGVNLEVTLQLTRYTASIDAALTLVPEGWRPYSADMSIKGRTRFLIEGPKTEWSTDDEGEKCAGNDWYAQGVAATPALALAAAALKARGV